jgi:hypothetical protein
MQTRIRKEIFMIEERRKIEFAAEVIGGFRGLPLTLYG